MRSQDKLEIEFALACPPSTAFGKARFSATAHETATKSHDGAFPFRPLPTTFCGWSESA